MTHFALCSERQLKGNNQHLVHHPSKPHGVGVGWPSAFLRLLAAYEEGGGGGGWKRNGWWWRTHILIPSPMGYLIHVRNGVVWSLYVRARSVSTIQGELGMEWPPLPSVHQQWLKPVVYICLVSNGLSGGEWEGFFLFLVIDFVSPEWVGLTTMWLMRTWRWPLANINRSPRTNSITSNPKGI